MLRLVVCAFAFSAAVDEPRSLQLYDATSEVPLKLDAEIIRVQLPLCLSAAALNDTVRTVCADVSNAPERRRCQTEVGAYLAGVQERAHSAPQVWRVEPLRYHTDYPDSPRVTRLAQNNTLVFELPWFLGDYGVASCLQLAARDLCRQLNQPRCTPCEESVARLISPRASADRREIWTLRDEATIRAAFPQLTSRQCVFAHPEIHLSESERVAAGGWPREFWRVVQHPLRVASITGRDQRVTCATHDAPVRVWFNESDLQFDASAGRGFFDIPGIDYTRLAMRQDATGCENRCEVVADRDRATLLVSEKHLSARARGQYAVTMSIEAKEHANAADLEAFDLTMDLSPEANVPLVLIPNGFWRRVRALPLPTQGELEQRRLAIWVASNCCRTTWDRQGYMMELAKHLGAELDFGGSCLGERHNASDVPCKGDGGWDDGAAMMGDADSAQLALYSRYWFVFSLVNAISNDNVDEKFFEPFLANSVPVVVAGSVAHLMAPGGSGSFIDATQFSSPAALAQYLLFLRRNVAEYHTYFAYRNGDEHPPASVAQMEEVSAFDPQGTLCRLCSCVCDRACMQKRVVSSCGYFERD